MDIENFIDYNIAQLFLANYDWPHVNIRFWKGEPEGYKWRWIIYDCDRSMILPDYDQLGNYILRDGQFNESPEWTTFLFHRLMSNPEFKEAFVQRFFYLLNTSFRSDHMLNELKELEDIYSPLMVDHIDRWGYPASLNTWIESLSELRGFIIKRPAVMVQQVMEYLGEQYARYPNPIMSGSDYVNLDMEFTENVLTRIEVFNLFGELVHSQVLQPSNDGQHPRISVKTLSPGMYVVIINYGTLLFSEKLLVR